MLVFAEVQLLEHNLFRAWCCAPQFLPQLWIVFPVTHSTPSLFWFGGTLRGRRIASDFTTPCVIVEGPFKLSTGLPTWTSFSHISEPLSGHHHFSLCYCAKYSSFPRGLQNTLCLCPAKYRTEPSSLCKPLRFPHKYMWMFPYHVFPQGSATQGRVNRWELWLLLLPLSSPAKHYWKKLPFLYILLIIIKVSIPRFIFELYR